MKESHKPKGGFEMSQDERQNMFKFLFAQSAMVNWLSIKNRSIIILTSQYSDFLIKDLAFNRAKYEISKYQALHNRTA